MVEADEDDHRHEEQLVRLEQLLCGDTEELESGQPTTRSFAAQVVSGIMGILDD